MLPSPPAGGGFNVKEKEKRDTLGRRDKSAEWPHCQQLIEQLEQCTGDAGEFQSLREANQAAICESCGITEWTDVILAECRAMVRQRLDSLSFS